MSEGAEGKDEDIPEDIRNDLETLHEDILDENLDGIREIMSDFVDDLDTTAVLLTHEVRLEDCDPDWGMTAIHRAAAVGNTMILEYLMSAGSKTDASLNCRVTRNDLTPLHLAAAEGHNRMVSYLAANGANIKARDVYGRSSMYLASEGGHRDVAQILTVKGASAVEGDKRNQTPLHAAARRGHHRMSAFLLKRDSDVNACDVLGQTPVFKAIRHQQDDVVELLTNQKSVDINKADLNGDTYLHAAIKTIKLCKDRRKKSLTPDSGCGMLMESSSGYTSSPVQRIVDTLLVSGCDVNAVDVEGNSALHLATSLDEVDLLTQLLDRKADLTLKNNKGQIALHLATSPEVIRLLIHRGSDPEAADHHGNRPLHMMTADHVPDEVMETFLGLSPVQVDARNVDGHTALTLACIHGSISKYKLLTAGDAVVDTRDAEGKTILHFAVMNRRHELTEVILAALPRLVDAGDNEGNTALHHTAQSGDLQLSMLLVEAGADVNSANVKGYTPSQLAVVFDHFELLKYFVQNGGQVDSERLAGRSPLNFFAACNDVENVVRLLDQGIDVNSTDSRGRTALHDATVSEARDVMMVLLEHGATSSGCDLAGNSLLHQLCVWCAELKLLQLVLMNGAQINVKNSSGESPLHVCLRSQRPMDIVSLLIAEGASVMATDQSGQSPLHLAVKVSSNDEDCLDLLLELLPKDASFPVDIQSKDGSTPLHLAADKNFPRTSQFLLDNGASRDLVTTENMTPLHRACGSKSTKCVPLLISSTNLQILDCHGYSVMATATCQGSLECLERLLESGGDGNLCSGFDTNPLCIAIKNRLFDLAEVLLMNEVDVRLVDGEKKSVLHLASRKTPASIVEGIIDLGADVNARDSLKRSPLHVASMFGEQAIVKTLLDRGADLNLVDGRGNSALHISARKGHYAVVDTLILHGALVNSENKSGQSPLHLACMTNEPDVLELLVANEADVNGLDDKGQSCLMIALCHGNVDTAMLLIEQDCRVDLLDHDGQSALHKAARIKQSCSSLIRILMKKGLSPNTRDSHGRSALDYANGDSLELIRAMMTELNVS